MPLRQVNITVVSEIDDNFEKVRVVGGLMFETKDSSPKGAEVVVGKTRNR